MAEEAALAGGETDPNAPPPDDGQAPPNDQPPEEQEEPEAIRDLAAKIGWTPKDQFRGDPEKWKPASEFIIASRDINQNLSRELRSVREEVSRIGRTSADLTEQIRDRAIAERDAYWRNRHAKAVEDGDLEAAGQAVDKLAELKIEAAKPKGNGADTGLPPDTVAWVEKNKAWFGSQGADGRFVGGDPLARTRAIELSMTLAKQGLPEDEQLRQVERAMRKEFPEHFEAPNKPPAATHATRGRSADTTSRAKGYADMPADSRKMADEYLRRHGIPVETFAKSYWAEQEGRKVA